MNIREFQSAVEDQWRVRRVAREDLDRYVGNAIAGVNAHLNALMAVITTNTGEESSVTHTLVEKNFRQETVTVTYEVENGLLHAPYHVIIQFGRESHAIGGKRLSVGRFAELLDHLADGVLTHFRPGDTEIITP